jgi:hypothetical protein
MGVEWDGGQWEKFGMDGSMLMERHWWKLSTVSLGLCVMFNGYAENDSLLS